MNITVFTSNQPRHLSLIRSLSAIADNVYAVIESNTIFPGLIQDFFKKSPVMQEYFQKVIQAEKNVFGPIDFLPNNVKPLVLKMHDLNHLSNDQLAQALNSDIYIVFGATFIKSWLVDFLIENKALNIHMGVSPYYRGSSCNFWAAYHGRYHMIGATIHLLSKGLDSGSMLFHALPKPTGQIFDLGMNAVQSAHFGLIQKIKSGEIFNMDAIKQDRSKEISYTRNNDFNDEVASSYLRNLPQEEQVLEVIKNADYSEFLCPYRPD